MTTLSNYALGFIKSYSKILICIYAWAFLGFIRPNVEFSSFDLPESIKHKSIILMMLGALIFNLLGYFFSVIVLNVVLWIIWMIGTIIWLKNLMLFFPRLEEERNTCDSLLIFVMYICIFYQYTSTAMQIVELIENSFLWSLLITLYRLIDTILEKLNNVFLPGNIFSRRINKSLFSSTRENKLVREVNVGQEIWNLAINLVIFSVSFSLISICYSLIVGVKLILYIEYLNIWTLSFPTFFLIPCALITIGNINNMNDFIYSTLSWNIRSIMK